MDTSPPRPPEERPPVTIFVLAYRQEATVREAVASALAQTYEPLEVLLSDDCSPDGTFRIMEEMAATYRGPHRVTLNRNPRNLGLVPHLDRVMELATGRLVVQNAGDDASEPERVERVVEAWRASGGRALAIHSAVSIVDGEGRRLGWKRSPDLMIEAPTPLNIARHGLFAHGAGLAWDRRIFEVFGPLAPEAIVEDAVIPFRAAILGEVAYVDAELVRWRVDGLSTSPKHKTGQDYLYGSRLKLMRWRQGHLRRMLADLEKVQFEGRDAVRCCVRERLEVTEFELETAGQSARARLARLPRAARLSLARRDPAYLRQHLKYLLEGIYGPYLDFRNAGRSA